MSTHKKVATYQDVLDAPDGLVAELIAGELHLSPRPATPHALATSALGEELGPPFKRGRGGPGGWIIVHEPELHLGPNVLVPDLAGWRRERLPALPDAPFVTTLPDWVCEVLSPHNARLDRTVKLPLYASLGLPHLWLVDPVARTLDAFRNHGGQWLLLASFVDDARVRAEPFEVFELDLSLLWADVARAPGPG